MVVANQSESVDPWQKDPENKSIEEEGRKPDMTPFKDEVEKDAVVAENEADRLALLTEVPGGKENKTEGVIDEDNDDTFNEEIPYQSEVLNVSPMRPRPKLVTPFRGRCPVCRKYGGLAEKGFSVYVGKDRMERYSMTKTKQSKLKKKKKKKRGQILICLHALL